VLRREVDFATRYRFEGGRDQGWHDCRVLDLSRGGAGVHLFATTPQEARNQRVMLELSIEPAVYHVVGEVRYANDEDGATRVGLRFWSLSALEQVAFDKLLGASSVRG
jgi:hypothetical protein